MQRTKRLGAAGLALVMCLLWVAGGQAGEWKPPSSINMRVPFAAGGSMDLATRIIGQGLQDKYGQTVIVSNLIGANGALAANDLLSTAPAPTELCSAAISLFTLVPLFNPDIKVDLDAFTIVANMISEDFILLVAPGNSGIKSYEELLAHGKGNRVLFGSNVPSGTTHMLQTALFGEAGINARAVTSSGSNKDLLALVAGDVVCTVSPSSLAAQFIEEGTLVPVLVFSDDPYTGYPGFTVPTARSKGLDLIFRSANFIMTRKEVDQAIVDQMYRDIQEYYKTEKFKTLAANAKYIPDYSDGATTKKLILSAADTCQRVFDKYYAKK